MSPFNMPNLSMLAGGRVSPREIERIVNKLDLVNSGNLAYVSSEDVRVAAIQLMRKPYASIAEYVVDMNLYMADAVNRRAQLVCFPAYAGVLPASLEPHFASAAPKLRPLAATGLPDPGDLNDVLSYFSDFIFDIYYYTMSELAARHGIYIMAGSTLYFEKDEPRHRAFLFNDSGDLVGFQDKISSNPLEQSLHIEPASELKIFETPFGGVSILICEDADYFEPARIAKNLGARILLSPAVFTDEHTSVDMALGLNMRVQENNIFGVRSTLVGDTGLGFATEGAGCVFSPNQLLMRKNGILAQTSGRYEPDITCARLNYDKLHAVENPYTRDTNPELQKKYIDRLY